MPSSLEDLRAALAGRYEIEIQETRHMPLGLSLKANARLVVAIHTALLVPAVTAQDQPATVADAASFVSMVESEYEVFGEYSARVSWIQANFITYDSNWLMTKVSAEGTELGVRFANGAKRFDGLELLPDLTRKMKLIKLGVNLPAPETPGAAQELAEINTRMRSHYATGGRNYPSGSGRRSAVTCNR